MKKRIANVLIFQSFHLYKRDKKVSNHLKQNSIQLIKLKTV